MDMHIPLAINLAQQCVEHVALLSPSHRGQKYRTNQRGIWNEMQMEEMKMEEMKIDGDANGKRCGQAQLDVT